jgi:hypothetical protein
VTVGLGTSVAGRLVVGSRIWVGDSVTGFTRSVGAGGWLVGDATVNEMSHARDMRMKRDRNKKAFFVKELCIVNLLSFPILV